MLEKGLNYAEPPRIETVKRSEALGYRSRWFPGHVPMTREECVRQLADHGSGRNANPDQRSICIGLRHFLLSRRLLPSRHLLLSKCRISVKMSKHKQRKQFVVGLAQRIGLKQ